MSKDTNQIIPSTIVQIGPLFKIEGGDIFLSPFRSFPLNGFDFEKILLQESPLLISAEKSSNDWFEKFPDCCSTHIKLKSLSNYKKENYSFIPQQIVNNLAYFIHCLEIFVDAKNWFDEITEYLDFLIQSFGLPEVGGHIFKSGLRIIIENSKFDNKDFSDDKRLDLLVYLEPHEPESDYRERDLGLLYQTFQKWLDSMPAFGMFIDLKQQLSGKIPINIFTHESKYNRYLGLMSFRMRSRKELLEFLLKMTNSMLKEVNDTILKDGIYLNNGQSTLIKVAEGRLKVKQSKLFDDQHIAEELKYLDIVEKCLEILIEYYEVITNVTKNDITNINTILNEIGDNVQDILSNNKLIRIEIGLLSKSNAPTNWIESNIPDEILAKITSEIENPELSDDKRLILLNGLRTYFGQIQNPQIDNDLIQKKLSSGDISVKQKLKFSLPIFLFTTFETEIEVSDKQKLPTSLRDIWHLLFK